MVQEANNGDRYIHVIGHRGAAALLPENTLASFAAAIELGVDAVECDVQATRDGHAVLMHDERIDRTTRGTGRVADMTLVQVRSVETGDGSPVPTFEELLDLVGEGAEIYCELKSDGTEEPVVSAVLDRGMQDQVTFISFSLPRLGRVLEVASDLQIGALFAAPTAKDLADALDLGVCYIGIHDRCVRPGTVERIRRAGVAAGVWTPNRLDAMQMMIDAGATHITTDRPDVLLRWLGRLNRQTGFHWQVGAGRN